MNPLRNRDGHLLLTGPGVADLLTVAVTTRGGALLDWRADHLDHQPGRSTTATFECSVRWPRGLRQELIGVTVRAAGPSASDQRARLFSAHGQHAAVWFYPEDPDLPGLARAAYPSRVSELLADRLVGRASTSAEPRLQMVTYRPRRRAVVRVQDDEHTWYLKVVHADRVSPLVSRHRMLWQAGLPVPELISAQDGIIVMAGLPGRPLAKALFDDRPPLAADSIVDLLDRLPIAALELDRRPAWADNASHFASIVTRALPSERRRVRRLLMAIQRGLAKSATGVQPTHGDFHEGQVFVQDGRIVGLLDVETLGPGRRSDDLACLVAHLSTVQGMAHEQRVRRDALLSSWLKAFDLSVDPTELRLRSAAVVLSLATGPVRTQESDWPAQTRQILDAAEILVAQAL